MIRSALPVCTNACHILDDIDDFDNCKDKRGTGVELFPTRACKGNAVQNAVVCNERSEFSPKHVRFELVESRKEESSGKEYHRRKGGDQQKTVDVCVNFPL